MLSVYHARAMRETAVFEFFVRRLPDGRNFLLAAGLEQALEFLETLRFDADDIESGLNQVPSYRYPRSRSRVKHSSIGGQQRSKRVYFFPVVGLFSLGGIAIAKPIVSGPHNIKCLFAFYFFILYK